MNTLKFLIVGMFFSFGVDNTIGQTKQSFRLSILGGNGFGTNTKVSNSSSATLQPYRLGVGVRAQYIFESNLSLGILFVAHKGESVTINTTQHPLPLTFKTRMQYQAIEIGYWRQLDRTYSLHPHLGVGAGEPKGNFSAEAASIGDPFDPPDISATGLRPFVSPSLSVFADIREFLFAGLEANYLAIADYKNANAFSVFLVLGVNISRIH